MEISKSCDKTCMHTLWHEIIPLKNNENLRTYQPKAQNILQNKKQNVQCKTVNMDE